MRKSVVLVLGLALVGCGKDKEKDKDKAGGGAATSGKKDDKPTIDFAGSAPELPAFVSKLKFGMPKAEAEAITKDHILEVSTRFSKSDKLQQVAVRTKEQLEPKLTKLWGPPIKTEKEVFWFNQAAGIRAHLPDYGKGEVVAFDAYEPLEKLLGEKGNAHVMANGKSLLGMTPDELKAALGDKLCKFDEQGKKIKDGLAAAEKDLLASMRDVDRTIYICNEVPRTVELYTGLGDQARFGYDGKLSSVHVSFATGKSPELIKQTAATLDKIYGGNPMVVDDNSGSGSDRWYFDAANKTQVKVSLGADYIGVSYSSLFPVAELIGGDKPGLSIEGPHMPVGTHEQIKADDPTHYAQRGESGYLYYPPTELNHGQTEIELEIYANEKKTHGYRTVIHHTGSEAQGDKVFELLKAKFGEPKKDGRSTDKDVYWKFSKNGRKVEARRVSQQWQITVTK